MVERQPSKLRVAGSNPVSRSINDFKWPSVAAREILVRRAGLSEFVLMLNIAAHVAQSAEHFLGKEEVTGSIPVMGFVRSC